MGNYCITLLYSVQRHPRSRTGTSVDFGHLATYDADGVARFELGNLAARGASPAEFGSR
jgi:hypothetical protein